MLKFIHADQNKDSLWHRWPFVYLHGEAERMNTKAFSEGGQAPDICMANIPMDEFVPCVGNGLPCRSWEGTVSIPCEVNGKPAVCVLSQDRIGSFGGRIALVQDFQALQHVMQPKEWR
jgi:hypothetical protein